MLSISLFLVSLKNFYRSWLGMIINFKKRALIYSRTSLSKTSIYFCTIISHFPSIKEVLNIILWLVSEELRCCAFSTSLKYPPRIINVTFGDKEWQESLNWAFHINNVFFVINLRVMSACCRNGIRSRKRFKTST